MTMIVSVCACCIVMVLLVQGNLDLSIISVLDHEVQVQLNKAGVKTEGLILVLFGGLFNKVLFQYIPFS